MPKAKLSQVATNWVDEESSLKKRGLKYVKEPETEEIPKKKQTFNLRIETIKRLWLERIKTDKPLSEIMDELVLNHLPPVDLESLNKKEEK
jgi:hypothetical protein